MYINGAVLSFVDVIPSIKCYVFFTTPWLSLSLYAYKQWEFLYESICAVEKKLRAEPIEVTINVWL